MSDNTGDYQCVFEPVARQVLTSQTQKCEFNTDVEGIGNALAIKLFDPSVKVMCGKLELTESLLRQLLEHLEGGGKSEDFVVIENFST